MRNLTVLRKKSFVGCIQPYQIYMEDASAPELEIDGKPCRKLGVLKNGKELTVSIPDGAVRIYAIADKLSKGFCYDYYDIPEGQENVQISGKTHYNPFAGNPFYFDKELDAHTKEQRKKVKKKSYLVMVISVVVGLILGFAIVKMKHAVKPETFQYDAMQITLTNAFVQSEYEGFTVCYDSRDVAVMVTQLLFSEDEGLELMSVQECVQAFAENNQYGATVGTKDSLCYFEYQWTNTDEGETYHYFCPVYKTGDSFWLVQFCTDKDNLDTYGDSFVEWAKSVSFMNAA